MGYEAKRERMAERINFENMGLSQKILRAVEDLGFKEATEIQIKAIPCMMKGRDLIGNSHTGSGKTAAFVIPALEGIDPEEQAVQVLVLCPTRELALQITDDVRKFSKYMENIRTLAIYGGEPIMRQIRELKNRPQIVVGTPGRIMDHMRRKTLKIDHVKVLVLDEADEMLNMGFREDMETIIKDIPEQRQTTLFSATMPKAILDITKLYLKDPEFIKVKDTPDTTPKIEESYFEIKSDQKDELLSRIIQLETPEKALVFCNTKSKTDTVAANLQEQGIKAECIHGDITQVMRTEIMRRFKKGMFNILVATDVAARGIDVDDLEIVFNYDIPIDKEYYTHRIGRTARAGKEGRSYTFVSGMNQMKELNEIMRYTRSVIRKRKNPSYTEINKKKMQGMMDKIEANIGCSEAESYKKSIEEAFGAQYSHIDIACALLKMVMEKSSTAAADIDETPDMEISRFHVNIGRKDSADKSKIIDVITKNNGIDRKDIGKLDLYKNFSYIDIPRKMERRVTDSLKNEFYNGRKIRIEPALKK
jgi:ATP-dependent RNA helicase DeaD